MWLECLQLMEGKNKKSSSYEGKKEQILEEIIKINIRFARCNISEATYNRLRKGLYEQLSFLEQEDMDTGVYAIQNLTRLYREGKRVEFQRFIKTTNLQFLYNPEQQVIFEQNKTLPLV
ncbi:hypothetical protein ACE38V_11360 [Cytobacillus sp. Hz8]|uniref:hypothetical protein n=1 Tax=Cytobacillus sp. Hz8 TaxID=3347168 RepID=UPI0035D6408D